MVRTSGATPLSIVALLGAAVFSGACSSSPSGPSGSRNLSGTWRGTATDSSGPGTMSWLVTSTGASITGTVMMSDTESGIEAEGTLSGELSGDTLDFTIRIPVGGFTAPFEPCAAEVTGRAQTSASTISGTYSGTNSCTGTVGSGQLTLTKG